MEIMTACGRQSVHYHTEDKMYCGVIQLWRPLKEKTWYDWDIFKGFLFDNELELWKLKDELKFEPPVSLIKKLRLKRRISKLQKLADLYSLSIHDPDKIADSIPRVPSFIGSL